jgi:hypothetical protein
MVCERRKYAMMGKIIRFMFLAAAIMLATVPVVALALEDCDGEDCDVIHSEDGNYRAWAWHVTSIDEDGEVLTDPDTGEPLWESIAAFVPFEGGFISVWPGPNMFYTGTPEDGFTGTFLVSDPGIEIEGEFWFVDANIRRETRDFCVFGMCDVRHYLYTRTDDVLEIWSEGPRSFLNISMLGDCIGVDNPQVSRGWSDPDLLMPFSFEADGTIVMDGRVYEHDDDCGMCNEEIGPIGTDGVIVVERSMVVTSGVINFRVEGKIDDRDDCTMLHVSDFIPFDGDIVMLLQRAEEIGGQRPDD